MKRLFNSLLVTFLLMLTVSSIANANGNADANRNVNADKKLVSEIRLAPENGDPIIKEVRVQKYSDGSIKKVITGSGKHDDGPISYTINYDLNKNTYTTKRNVISTEVEDQQQKNTALRAPVWNKTLKVTTQDLPTANLVYTKAFLWWYDLNGTPIRSNSGIATWAAYPSAFGTHWYVDSQSSYGYDDNGDGTVGQLSSASFHNTDFGDTSKATYVYHTLELWGTAIGSYDYRIESIASGEYEALLHEIVDIT